MRYSQALAAYKELVETGGIQCTAEGKDVLLDLRGNVAGDILVFIGPKNNAVAANADIYDLIRSDTDLEKQSAAVFKSLRQKYRGLSLLPESLIWLVITSIAAVYIYFDLNKIAELLTGQIDFVGILNLLPLVVLTAVTPFLSKTFGFKALKPILSLVVSAIKYFRKVRNRKVT